ncbi:MAG: PQQ-binding-like beta-propeller repeat protein [Acidobacteriota bacterium]|nr:PQQ-binding-like beta-propeller repeat protein [Acidobacteriota bacterium]
MMLLDSKDSSSRLQLSSLVLLTALGLFACGSGGETTAEVPAGTPAQPGPAADASPVEGSWPAYRGAAADGVVADVTLPAPWPEGGPPEIWSRPLGPGYSGLAIVDNRLFTLFNQGDSQWAGAFSAATGEELWRHRLDKEYRDRQGDGPRSTPTVVDGVVYALSASGQLDALKAEDGSVVWSKNLKEAFGARSPSWGVSTQPMVDGDVLLVDVGGRDDYSVVGLDRKTGGLKWSTGSDGAGYSQPVIFEAAGRRQAVFFTASQLLAVDPATGEQLWRRPWKTSYDVNAATPIFLPPNRLLVSSGYDTGAALLEIVAGEGGSLETREVWSSRRLKNQFSSSVVVGDRIYGFDNSILKAVDLNTGEDVWRQRGFQHGSLLATKNHLVVLGENCRLALVEINPDEYREISSVDVLGDKCWTMPTLVDGRLFLRDGETLLSLRVAPLNAPEGS